MASTNKTPLGLNQWIETDRPKRSDFVNDNAIIDMVIGAHISDEDKHLTSFDEKLRVSEPFKIRTVFGTGTSSTLFRLNFEPKLVIVFRKDSAPVEYTGGYMKINAAIATDTGTSGGILISGDCVNLQQSTTAVNGVLFNLNQELSEYILVAFR